MSEVRGGWEEPTCIRGQGQWAGGATPCPRSGGFTGEEGLEKLSHVEGQEGHR